MIWTICLCVTAFALYVAGLIVLCYSLFSKTEDDKTCTKR